MNKLVFASLLLVPLGIALVAPGCADTCGELADICERCLDPDYRAACDAVANEGAKAQCSAEQATYESFCPDLSTIEGVGGSTGTTGGGECDPGEALCNGVCIGVNGDPANCGGCGTTCSDGEFCVAGACSGSCADPPNTDCGDGVCANVQTSPDNCGSCGTTCGETEVCDVGTCAIQCSEGLTDCSRACVDLSNDLANCGGCGIACGTGEVCANGTCQTDCGSLTACCGECVDTSSDPAHCGGCDPACPDYVAPACESCLECGDVLFPNMGDAANLCDEAGGSSLDLWDAVGTCATAQCPTACAGDLGNQTCLDCLEMNCMTDVAACQADSCEVPMPCAAGELCDGTGTCGTSCASGKTDCFGACVDAATVDGNTVPSTAVHCGSCGNVCTGGATCVDGVCNTQGTCADGKTNCNGTCADIDSDPANCGSCGNTCTAGAPLCNGGTCSTTCTAPLVACSNNACVDVTSDPENCGACGTVCSGGTPACEDTNDDGIGECVTACSSQATDCGNGSCIRGDTILNCGSCGNSCNDNDVCTADFCISGTCQNTGGTQACSDGNTCTKDECDPVTGCTNPPYTQQEIEGICGQLKGWDPATSCVYCDPQGELCEQSGPGGPCTDLGTGVKVNSCVTCTQDMVSMAFSCEGANQACPGAD